MLQASGVLKVHPQHVSSKKLAKQCQAVSSGIGGVEKCVCKSREVPEAATKAPINKQQADNLV